jgi:general secretion pathway protein G
VTFQGRAGRLRWSGFSLVELAVAIAVLSGLLYFLLDRVLYMQEVAEKTEVEETVRSINYGLRLEAASRLARGAEAGRVSMEKENPIKWLQSPPRNYLGEYAKAPENAKRGYWFFQPDERQLIYRPNRANQLSVLGTKSKEIKFVVRTDESLSQPQLEPYAPYAWFDR